MSLHIDPNTCKFVPGGIREVPVMEPPRIKDEYLEEFFDSEEGSENILFGAFRYGKRTVKASVPDYFVYERVCYAARPVDIQRQVMNIYIPAPYMTGSPETKVGEFTASTAPIVFMVPGGGFRMHGLMRVDGDELGRLALERGMIVAAADIRGCEDHNVDLDGDGELEYTGTAPAQLVDLKAAVRFMRYNADVLPGDYSRIMATGGSSGGAMAELLAVSGNCRRFDKELKLLGAADASDDIQAVIPFCGPADLEHADMAYDWFFGRYIYQVHMKEQTNMWNVKEQVPEILYDSEGHIQLKPNYLAGETAYDYYSDYAKLFVDEYLHKVLHMSEKEYVALCMQYLIPACAEYMRQHPGKRKEHYYFFDSYEEYLNQGGTPDPYYDSDAYPDGGYIHFDLYRGFNAKVAFKSSPAFDRLEKNSMIKYENALFGTEKTGVCNFTQYGAEHSDLDIAQLPDDVVRRVQNQNPLTFIGDGESVCCKHWLIPHGSADGDIALCQSIDLVTKLRAAKINDVTFDILWNGGHSCGMVTPSKSAMLDWTANALRI